MSMQHVTPAFGNAGNAQWHPMDCGLAYLALPYVLIRPPDQLTSLATSPRAHQYRIDEKKTGSSRSTSFTSSTCLGVYPARPPTCMCWPWLVCTEHKSGLGKACQFRAAELDKIAAMVGDQL